MTQYSNSVEIWEAPSSSCSFRVRIALNLLGIKYVSHNLATAELRRHPDYLKVNPQALVPFLAHGNVRLGQSLAILEYLHEVAGEGPDLKKEAVLGYLTEAAAKNGDATGNKGAASNKGASNSQGTANNKGAGSKGGASPSPSTEGPTTSTSAGPTQSTLLPRAYPARGRARSLAQYIISEIQPLQNTRLAPYLSELGVDAMAFRRHWVVHGLAELERALGHVAGAFCVGDSPTVADCCLVPQVWNAIHVFKIDLSCCPTITRIYEHCLQQDAFQRALPEKQPGYKPW